MSRPVHAHPGDARVEFRPFRSRDLDAICAIERATFPEPWTREQFAGLLAHPAGLGWVAESRGAGTIAGAIGYAIGWVAGDEAELADLAVAAPDRGRGIGAGLVKAFAREAGVRGARHLYLEVRDSNAGARRFYDRLGFEVVGRRAGYYRTPREDALVLRSPLPLSRVADDPNLG